MTPSIAAVDGMANPNPVQVRELEFPNTGFEVPDETGKAPGVIHEKTPPPMSADTVAAFVSVAI
jgi:hypothetical protein